MNFLTMGNGGHVPSSKIMSRWLIPRAVKYVGEYSSELRRTTRPTLRLEKCERTFLNGPGRSDFLTSEALVGTVAYNGESGSIGATG